VSQHVSLTIPVGGHDHVRGYAKAAITLVEYGDYQCPYCGEAATIVEELQSALGDGLLFVFRNLPLVQVHPHAQAAAELAEAAGMQGKFWEMHDTLYQNQDDLRDEMLELYARNIGLDPGRLASDLSSGQPRERVEADFEGAIRSGANGTPTFFVNGHRYDGSWQFDPFREYLTSLL
jgi:protein-disulfide isomerase